MPSDNLNISQGQQPVNFEHYGSLVEADKMTRSLKKIANAAQAALHSLAVIIAVPTYWVGIPFLGAIMLLFPPTWPVIVPILGGLFATALAAYLLSLVFFKIETHCHSSLTSHPPIDLAPFEYIFENQNAMDEMIKHATAPKEVIKQIAQLKPAYETLKKDFQEKSVELTKQREEAKKMGLDKIQDIDKAFSRESLAAQAKFLKNQDASAYNTLIAAAKETADTDKAKIEAEYQATIARIQEEEQKSKKGFEDEKLNLMLILGRAYKANELAEISTEYDKHMQQIAQQLPKQNLASIEEKATFVARKQKEHQDAIKPVWIERAYRPELGKPSEENPLTQPKLYYDYTVKEHEDRYKRESVKFLSMIPDSYLERIPAA